MNFELLGAHVDIKKDNSFFQLLQNIFKKIGVHKVDKGKIKNKK